MEDINNIKDSSKESIFKKNLGAIYVVIAGVVFFFLLYRSSLVKAALSAFYAALKPIFTGVVIAFLLNPLVKLFERLIFKGLSSLKKNDNYPFTHKKRIRAFSILLSMAAMIYAILFLFKLVIPQVVASTQEIIADFPSYLDSTISQIEFITEEQGGSSQVLLPITEDFTEFLKNWLKTDLADSVGALARTLASGLMGVLGLIYNLLIGIIISAYILIGKERFIGGYKKITYALMNEEKADLFIEILGKVNYIFTGAILGKLLDSMIIGIICFIGTSILGIFFSAIGEFSTLVSVIVGVTNIVPFFGPYIGGIPSALLILLVNPLHGLIFAVFLILLQQFDCNYLDPRIVGGRVGLPAFWVLFACLVGGSLFGFYGLLLSVPIFAVVYYLIKIYIESKLKRKKMSLCTEDYVEK